MSRYVFFVNFTPEIKVNNVVETSTTWQGEKTLIWPCWSWIEGIPKLNYFKLPYFYQNNEKYIP